MQLEKRKNRLWTDGDIKFLKANVNKMTNVEMGSVLKCDASKVANALKRFHIKRDKEFVSYIRSSNLNNRKLNRNQVKKIYFDSKHTYKEIADKFGVSESLVSYIKSKKRRQFDIAE